MISTSDCYVIQEGEYRFNENFSIDAILIRIVLRISNNSFWYCVYLGYDRNIKIIYDDSRFNDIGISFTTQENGELKNFENYEKNYNWIGWDYNHAGNYCDLSTDKGDNRFLYFKEIEKDTLNAVNTLKSIILNNEEIIQWNNIK